MQNGSIVGDILLVLLVTHLVTTAYGLTVIETLKPIIADKLKNKGYEQLKKNSLYDFNEKFINVLMLFVPGYYFSKALNLIQGDIDRAVDEEIVSGRYVTKDEQAKIFEQTELEKKDDSLFIPESKIVFEKPEKYKARRQDLSLYNTYETPMEFISKVMHDDESLNLTPFVDTKNTIIEPAKVTSKDVATFIGSLSHSELIALRNKIDQIIDMEEAHQYRFTLDKGNLSTESK